MTVKKQSIQKTNPDTKEEVKKRMLGVAFSQIDKHYGQGSVMYLGQSSHQEIDSISSGSILVDKAIGVGGYPRGRIIEIFGPESSGKTTLAMQAIAHAQKCGGIGAFIDAEHALDATYATNIGININDLIISQPDYGEQALDIAEMLIRSGAIDMIVIDSVAALVPKAELEGDMGDTHVGLQARLMSQALRKLTPVVHKSRTVLIFINQVRHKINSLPFANKETTSGGNALKFYSSVRIDVRKIASLKKGDEHFGNRIKIRMVKNKVAPPFKCVEVDLLFSRGISKELELLDVALSYNFIQQSGAWFSYKGEKIAQGREQVLNYLQQNTNIAQELYKEVKQAMNTIE